MDIELKELRREFLEEAEAKILEIRSRLREIGQTPSEESLKRMIDLAHQLKGAGGSYGYAAISDHAAKLEEGLESVGRGGGNAYEALEPLTENLSREITEQRAAIERGQQAS